MGVGGGGTAGRSRQWKERAMKMIYKSKSKGNFSSDWSQTLAATSMEFNIQWNSSISHIISWVLYYLPTLWLSVSLAYLFFISFLLLSFDPTFISFYVFPFVLPSFSMHKLSLTSLFTHTLNFFGPLLFLHPAQPVTLD